MPQTNISAYIAKLDSLPEEHDAILSGSVEPWCLYGIMPPDVYIEFGCCEQSAWV